jgi:UDP-N-acetyl-D-mannosaminuronic acid transferase (WecB/TagA/CpsF family)
MRRDYWSWTPWRWITGADRLRRVLESAAADGRRVGFLGGTFEANRLLAEVLERRHPMLEVAGMFSPGHPLIDLNCVALAQTIRACRIDVLVVSVGTPGLEDWVDRYGPTTGVNLFLPVGATIDALVDTVSRHRAG